MKKLLLSLFILIFASAVFAQEVLKPGQLKPSKNDVIVVMKVNLKIDVDRDFIAATRGVENKDAPDTFFIPVDHKKLQVQNFVTDSYGIVVTQKNNNIGEISYIEYNFFGSLQAAILLPFEFTFVIPSDAKAVYLGCFDISVDKDFNISDVRRIDEYEIAQKALDDAYQTHIDLVRIEDLSVQ